jgi:hypothetical protein
MRTLPIRAVIAVLMAAYLPLYGGVESSRFGGGEPGLKIIYKDANQYVVFVDEPWTVGPGLIGGYNDRQIAVLFDKNYGLKEKLRTRTWDDNPEQLYPFDDKTAFTSDGANWDPVRKVMTWPGKTQIFSINGDGVVVSNDVYALARAHYGLATNQLFLGKIGTNIFYWETQDSRRVFYHPAAGDGTTNYFEFPKGVLDIMGVTQGVKEKDNIGFTVLRKSKGFSYSPNEFTFIEVSYKNAKQIKGNQ